MKYNSEKIHGALVAYIVFALSISCSTFYFVSLCYHTGPFRDMWIAMDFIRAWQDHAAHLTDFFALHGGAHRLAVPRLLFLMEYEWFSGSNVFLIGVAFATQLSVVFLVWRMLKQESHLSRYDRWFVVALTLILMLNATQLENFIYTFDVQWFVTSAAAVWALVFWNRLFAQLAANAFSFVTLLGALIATLLAMFSSFSGLCVWLVLPVLALVYRVRYRNILLLSAGVIIVIAMYLQGPFATGGGWSSPEVVTAGMVCKLLWLLLKLWLQWTGLYFGSPLSRFNVVAGALVAYGSLGFLFWQWWQCYQSGVKDHTPLQMIMLSAALWAAIVGLATGIGRMYFVHTAPEDRYQSIVLVYWLGLFGFAVSRALQYEMQSGSARYRNIALSVVIFWSGVVIPVASIHDAYAQVNFFDRVKDADLAIATGQWDYNEIHETLILGDKTKKINRPEMHAAFLRDRHWGVFASAGFALLATTVDRTSVSADRCEGSIDTIAAVKAPYRGYRIIGRGQDVQREALLTSYIAIDEAGQVVGLGRLQRQKDSLKPLTWQPVGQAHWLLYTENLHEPRNLQILGVLDDGGYCVMASAKLPSPSA